MKIEKLKNVSEAELKAYKTQKSTIIRRRVNSSSINYSNICIMTDADTDG